MSTRVEFNLLVTASLGYDSLLDWCYQTMLLFSAAQEDSDDDALKEKNGAEILRSKV